MANAPAPDELIGGATLYDVAVYDASVYDQTNTAPPAPDNLT